MTNTVRTRLLLRRGTFMRFSQNGPSLPDSLLHARDQGRVVFICGAGVSQERAGLPDFFGLAQSVIHELGVSSDSATCKVFKKAQELGEQLDVTGLISVDRVFALLEREFTIADIQSAIAKCLKPTADVDRSAHEILLRLARTPNGKTQIVTTNFDRLFEGKSDDMPVFQPPRLPQPSRYDDLDGIVYLHGRVNGGYRGADGDGFVLSSSDFGHAYLSEGWATEFLREILRSYVVVFVGYSADDPPVHYLLEGLRRTTDSLNRIFAFQADESAELIAGWQHKGVEAIPYSPADKHFALWQTLEQWAIRADDPHEWQQSVLSRALRGPDQMQPHERGQVAHIVSTYEGARAFAESKPTAEWLCVFDPFCRYRNSSRRDWFDSDHPIVEPFSLYGLDSDPVPQRNDEDFYSGMSTIPTDAWDAFALNDTDFHESSPENFPAVRGSRSYRIPRLPNRLACLGMWIADVANQPAALWWAARQESLHPDFRARIEWELSKRQIEVDDALRRAWQYILEAWDTSPVGSQREWQDLRRDIKHDGWSSAGVRRLVDLTRPYLKIGPAPMAGAVPPKIDEDFRIFDLVRIEVECPVLPQDALIPDEWLLHVARGLRSNLEVAARLCEEVDDRHRLHISPIVEDDRPDISNYQRTHGLSGCVITFSSLFERLLGLELQRATEEFSSWPTDDEVVFARLRLWASGKPELATPHSFAQLVRGLSDDVFWGSYHQRDLLLVLARRWREMSTQDRRHIESRLLRGPGRLEGEADNSFKEHRAWEVLQRLQWLRTHECHFSIDVDGEIATRRLEAPKWKPVYANRAAESREIRGGAVTTNTEYGPLMRVPIATVLSKAIELSGRSETNSLQEHDPFAGLSAERPRRAYLALVHAAKRNEYPPWAWRSFLNSSARENDPPCFSTIIAALLCRLPDAVLLELLSPATWWFERVSRQLSKDSPDSFDQTVQRFIDVVQDVSVNAFSPVTGANRGRDWVTEAVNSPVGHVIRALLKDVRFDADLPDTIKPCLESIERCLALSGDPRRHAIALISHHIGWLHRNEPEWVERHLLSVLDAEDDEDRDSLWAGFFWNPEISSRDLYLRMKGQFLKLAKQEGASREPHVRALAYLILRGWVSSDGNEGRRWIADAEFRDVLLHGGDEFGSHVLWQFERALSNDDTDERKKWQAHAAEFFQNIWPRQKSVKTSRMTERLFGLLVSHQETFVALIDVVSPLLTTIGDGTGWHFYLGEEMGNIVQSHPERFLHLLHTVLPDDVRNWPYGIGDAIDMIAEADDSLATDARLVELRRKWKVN